METLARATIRGRWLFVGLWLILTVAGVMATGKLADRWFEQFSIPGYSAYEANQRTLETFGTGRQYPLVAVFQVKDGDDIRAHPGIEKAIAAGAAVNEGSRVSSWFDTNDDTFVSADHKTMFANIYPTGEATFESILPIKETRAAIAANAPAGVTSHVTGVDAIFQSQGGASGPSVLAETLLGGIGALLILLFVFGTLPAVLMPLLVAISSILTTFLCVLGLTYVTDVSIIVQFLVALVGLGIAIDYSLLMIFRFREEIAHGRTTDEAIVETMQHAGRSVIVSGTTVAIGLVSMVILPLPFIRSIGLGGMLIPLVSRARLDHADTRAAAPARAEDQPAPRDAEEVAHEGRRRVRVLDALGRHGVEAAARDLPGGHGRRRPAPDPRLSDQSERRRDGQATCDGRRRRGPAGARGRGHHAWCLQAVRRPRRRHERSREGRCDHGRGAQRRRRSRA